jgi:hypothetical protein
MIHGVGRDAAFIVRAIRERSALRGPAVDRSSSALADSPVAPQVGQVRVAR